MTETTQAMPVLRTSRPVPKNWGYRLTGLFPHVILSGYSVLALFPLILILLNSFKDRKDLFRTPYVPPIWFSFDGGFHILRSAKIAFSGVRINQEQYPMQIA